MTVKPRTIEDFREKHDPTYQLNVHKDFGRKLRKGCRTFIITAAQNATPVSEDWWAVLQQMAAHRDAELLVIPIRYKNPTSQWSGSAENAEWWSPEVRDYLWNRRHTLNKKLVVLGDFKIQPTASEPLSGAEAMSHEQSGIIGHTKLQMLSIPTPASRMAKVLTTTGVCTVENYTDSRAGRVGEFHHSLSAVIVEVSGTKRFHLRHVHFDKKSGSAIDLDMRYTPAGVEAAPRPLALIMGDTHVGAIDPLVERATFGQGGMVPTLKPQRLVWHDVLDSYSCTPHHLAKPFITTAKGLGGAADVRKEVETAVKYVSGHTPDFAHSFIVRSNHDDMLARWMNRADWREDPQNADFYLETAIAMRQGSKLGPRGVEYPDPFTLWVEAFGDKSITVLKQDESLNVGGVELGMHGDRGPNGARGSIRNLRRIGVKSVIGHSHSPGINEGCYQTGTSTYLRLEYNHGASSWLNCHCVLHADGKRQLVVIVDGHWRS